MLEPVEKDLPSFIYKLREQGLPVYIGSDGTSTNMNIDVIILREKQRSKVSYYLKMNETPVPSSCVPHGYNYT
jgi:hypothetical protein